MVRLALVDFEIDADPFASIILKLLLQLDVDGESFSLGGFDVPLYGVSVTDTGLDVFIEKYIAIE